MPAGRPAGRPEISLRKSLRKSLSPAQPIPCFEKGPRSLLENGRFLRPHEAYSFFANGPLLRPYEARSSFENGPQSLLENGPSSTSTPPLSVSHTQTLLYKALQKSVLKKKQLKLYREPYTNSSIEIPYKNLNANLYTNPYANPCRFIRTQISIPGTHKHVSILHLFAAQSVENATLRKSDKGVRVSECTLYCMNQ